MNGDQKLTVLIVEDELDIRETLSELLRMEGFSTMLASNGQDALDLLESLVESPDLIILDLMMPRMNGREFLKRRSNNPAISTIPVIAVSAGHMIYKIEHADAFLSKPLDFDKLMATIHRLCPP